MYLPMLGHLDVEMWLDIFLFDDLQDRFPFNSNCIHSFPSKSINDIIRYLIGLFSVQMYMYVTIINNIHFWIKINRTNKNIINCIVL